MATADLAKAEAPFDKAAISNRDRAFADDLQKRTFDFFWDTADADTGLVPDRYPSPSFSSIAAVGFGLTAYPVGAERGWVTRQAAAERTAKTLRFLYGLPMGDAAEGVAGYKGFYYHFLDMKTGHRFEQVELSTIDTALLMAGVLFSSEYFDGHNSTEREIRQLADKLYRRVDWNWAAHNAPLVTLGWSPEEGFLPYDWRGYNEGMLLYVLALGSPTHPVPATAWAAWAERYRLDAGYGPEHVGFPPLFGHQYSHIWVDFRGIADPYMRARGSDYFINSQHAVESQIAYAKANPMGWTGYGEQLWGITASDGPGDFSMEGASGLRTFRSYSARGPGEFDDGTIAPTAAGGSIAFAPARSLAVLQAMKAQYGAPLYGRYGFVDAFNPTLKAKRELKHGQILEGVGWFGTDYLGIDQGPILTMAENARSELIWRDMRRNSYIRKGLKRAGFTGGWLDKER